MQFFSHNNHPTFNASAAFNSIEIDFTNHDTIPTYDNYFDSNKIHPIFIKDIEENVIRVINSRLINPSVITQKFLDNTQPGGNDGEEVPKDAELPSDFQVISKIELIKTDSSERLKLTMHPHTKGDLFFEVFDEEAEQYINKYLHRLKQTAETEDSESRCQCRII